MVPSSNIFPTAANNDAGPTANATLYVPQNFTQGATHSSIVGSTNPSLTPTSASHVSSSASASTTVAHPAASAASTVASPSASASSSSKEAEGSTAKKSKNPKPKKIKQLHNAARITEDNGKTLSSSLKKIVEDLVKEARDKNIAFNIDTPETTPARYTALMAAVNAGSLKNVEYLLQQGADPNARDAYGKTVLLLAVEAALLGTNNRRFKIYIDIIALLLNQPSIEVDLVYEDNMTPLMAAAHKGNCEIGNLFIKKEGLLKKVDLDSATENKTTALMLAAEGGHLGFVKILVEANANTISINEQENNALMIAAKEKHFLIVEYLLKHSRVKIDQTNTAGENFLQIAASKFPKKMDKINELLSNSKQSKEKEDSDSISHSSSGANSSSGTSGSSGSSSMDDDEDNDGGEEPIQTKPQTSIPSTLLPPATFLTLSPPVPSPSSSFSSSIPAVPPPPSASFSSSIPPVPSPSASSSCSVNSLTPEQMIKQQDDDIAARAARIAQINSNNDALEKKAQADAKAAADKIVAEILAKEKRRQQLIEEERILLAKQKEMQGNEYINKLMLSFAAKQLNAAGMTSEYLLNPPSDIATTTAATTVITGTTTAANVSSAASSSSSSGGSASSNPNAIDSASTCASASVSSNGNGSGNDSASTSASSHTPPHGTKRTRDDDKTDEREGKRKK